MARGRRTGFGRGFGFGHGRGMGNPYPFCRNFPWLPRWLWSGTYGATAPGTYQVPYYGYLPYGRWIR